MKSSLFFLVILTAVHSLVAAPVEGVVRLTGTPPPEISIKMGADCAAAQKVPPTTRHYVVSKNGGLANVFVVVREGVPARTYPVPSEPAMMEAIDCWIQPHVIAVQTNQPVLFRNDGPFMENLHFTPKLNRGRNFALMAGGKPITLAFDRPEDFIRVKGDVHEWWFAYVCVVDHPFFAVTGVDGTFRLPDGLPDGTYTLESTHLKAGKARHQINVRDGRADRIEIQLSVPQKNPRSLR